MSQNQFSSLMNQYGNEAENQKVIEHCSDHRSQIFRQMRRIFLLMLLVAAFAGAVVYRNQVQLAIATVTNKFRVPSPYAKAEGNTKLRIADISKEAEQRKEAIEATYK
jgi:hypothetical protein